MSIALISLLIYFLFLCAFAIYSAFAIYHLWRFGWTGDLCKPVAISYIIISAVVIIITLILTFVQFLAKGG